MMTNRSKALLTLVLLMCNASPMLHAQPMPQPCTDGTTLERMKGVYDRGEFRAKEFRADWLPDSSGYSIRERDPQTGSMVAVHYDVTTGKPFDPQPGIDPSSGRHRDGSPMLSPDGKRRLEFRDGDLFVKSLESDETIQLTQRPPNRDISFHGQRWSPDGKYVAVIETDQTDVRQRAMLVPDDPSYPGVRERRFARVGEKIAVLRVAIIDAATGEQAEIGLD